MLLQDENLQNVGLMPLLRELVQREVLDLAMARRIEKILVSTDMGLLQALEEFGVTGHETALEELLALSDTAESYHPTSLKKDPSRRLSWASYAPWRGNGLVLSIAAQLIAQKALSERQNPLLIVGGKGLGKTRLLSAIALALNEVQQAIFFNLTDLEAELERAARLNARAELRRFISSHPVVLIDDFHLCQGHYALQRELLAIIEDARRDIVSLVMTTSVAPDELADVVPLLCARCAGGLVVTLVPGEREEQLAYLMQQYAEQNIPVEVFNYLLDFSSGEFATLLSNLQMVLSYRELTHLPATLDVVRALLDQPQRFCAEQPWRQGVRSPGTEMKAGQRFYKMLASASTEEEQAFVLQLALGAWFRQVQDGRLSSPLMSICRDALQRLREGAHLDAARMILAAGQLAQQGANKVN